MTAAPRTDAPTTHADLRALAGRIAIAVLVSAGIAGLAVGLLDASLVPVGLTAVVALIACFALQPSMAAYAWLLLCPLIVGVARADGILAVRPNEALLLLMAMGIGLRALDKFSRRERLFPEVCDIDLAMVALVVTGSLLPVLLRFGRGLEVERDDILYAFVFCKYLVLYAIFRIAIADSNQIERCLKLALIAGAIVAVIALLQIQGLFGVPLLLHEFYDSPFEGATGPQTLRGTSTIASSFGLADTMAICLGLVIAWLSVTGRHKVTMSGAGLLFLGGCMAAGSFSGVIGCAVIVGVLAILTRRVIHVLALAVPAVAIATVVSWNGIMARLDGFSGYVGLPHSWVGRLENLERFFWPEVFSGFNWLLGVRPAARVPAPESWRNWVYIESGHTWLLWTGGVALFAAYLALTVLVSRRMLAVGGAAPRMARVTAMATIAATAMIFVLMLFDPHLTVRGTADLYFPLLALATVANYRSGLCHQPSLYRMPTPAG